MSINKGLFTSNSDEYSTPMDLFNTLNNEFNFTLDPCSTDENAKCNKHYTKTENGLIQDWNNEVVFCNPPYGRQIGLWVKKCYEHFVSGGVAVMLIPARTDTLYFHKYIYNIATEIRFIKGRLKFGDTNNSAPFPSMIVIYNGTKLNSLKKETEQ